MKTLPLEVEQTATEIVNIAFKIHKTLGPGLLESIYERCFCYELERNHIPFSSQIKIPIVYEKIIFSNGLRLDLLVDNSIIVELKAQDDDHPIWKAQLLSYLRLTNLRLGFIINFHTPLIKDGIKRMIL